MGNRKGAKELLSEVLQKSVAAALEEQEFESEFSFQYNAHDLSSWGLSEHYL